MLSFLIILFLSVLIVGVIFITTGYFSHRETTIKSSNIDVYDYASYWSFKREFGKYEWEIYNTYDDFIFMVKEDKIGGVNKAIAKVDRYGVIRFNGKGMVMRTPIDFLLMRIYIAKYLRKQSQARREKGLWKEND